jgi:outer membrane lipoprotein
MRMLTLLGFGALILLVSGCATDAGQCRRPIGDPGLTPAMAAASGEHQGERVTWGGTLVEVRNLERDTELEVIGMPLGDCGRPRTGSAAVGRFIVVRPGYLEAADLRPGAPVTATGEIIGMREGRIGDSVYRFPLLRDPAPVIWSDQETPNGWPSRPMISIGIGAGSGGWRGGGIGLSF